MKKTLEYVQSHFRGLTRRNRFGGRWEWGPEVIQRLTDPLAHPILEGSRYDYRNQAWLVNGGLPRLRPSGGGGLSMLWPHP